MEHDSRMRARDRVLYLLKKRGPQTVSELARRLGVTAMAVRQHLSALRDEGLVEFEEERRRVGRPARVWRLGTRSAAHFPNSHARLTVDLLESLRASFGEAGVDRLLEARMRRQLEAYRDQMPGRDAAIERRVAALAAIRRREGYMAEWRRSGEGFSLVENHCPIGLAAQTCRELCQAELSLFRGILGSDAHVRRTEHLLAGARRCAYRIAPLGA
jgi:predicted ArsR family transcriptional regulator